MLTMEVTGLSEMQFLLKELSKVADVNKGVSLNSVQRDDDAVNEQILEYLADQGRDFGEISDAEMERIAGAYAVEYQKRINSLMKKQARAAQRMAKGGLAKGSEARAAAFLSGDKGKDGQQVAKQIANACLKKAMDEYMRIVTEHIESQTGPDGAPLENPKLTESYEKQKMKDVGFAYPIGKRSGQLLDNLNADGVGARNIKIHKT